MERPGLAMGVEKTRRGADSFDPALTRQRRRWRPDTDTAAGWSRVVGADVRVECPGRQRVDLAS